MSNVFGAPFAREIGYTLLTGGRGGHVGHPRNWDTYMINGREQRLTSKEARQMMGFPEDFVMPVSETQKMKQFGNAVAVPVVEAVGKEILKAIHCTS